MYLDVFDEDKEGLLELKDRYEKGGVGDVEVKERLIGVLNNVITPIRKKREELTQNPKQIMKILEDGTSDARKVAEETLYKVKKAMKIDYFSE